MEMRCAPQPSWSQLLGTTFEQTIRLLLFMLCGRACRLSGRPIRRCQAAVDVHVVSDSDVDEADGGQAGTQADEGQAMTQASQASQDPYLVTSTAIAEDHPEKRIKTEGCPYGKRAEFCVPLIEFRWQLA